MHLSLRKGVHPGMVGCIKIACTWTNVWVYSGRGVCFIIITIYGLLKTVSLFAKGKITLNSQLKDYVKKIVLREGGSLIVLNKLYNKSKHFKWIQNNVKIRFKKQKLKVCTVQEDDD